MVERRFLAGHQNSIEFLNGVHVEKNLYITKIGKRESIVFQEVIVSVGNGCTG